MTNNNLQGISVSVGIPTRNRPEGLNKTINDIRSQTHTNLEIIVSDNNSSDAKVSEIIHYHMRHDSRLKFISQENNIGAGNNFLHVYGESTGEYFMWAADDDRWSPEYIEVMLRLLEDNRLAGLAFCNTEVIESDGTIDNSYGNFYETFITYKLQDSLDRVVKYLLQPPQKGKANLIYGLFRKKSLDSINLSKRFRSKAWGSDMLLIADILSGNEFMLSDKTLYRKDRECKTKEQLKKTKTLPLSNKSRFINYLDMQLSKLRYVLSAVLIVLKTKTNRKHERMTMSLKVFLALMNQDF